MVRESPMRSGLKPWMVSFRLEAPRGLCYNNVIKRFLVVKFNFKNEHFKLQDYFRKQGNS